VQTFPSARCNDPGNGAKRALRPCPQITEVGNYRGRPSQKGDAAGRAGVMVSAERSFSVARQSALRGSEEIRLLSLALSLSLKLKDTRVENGV